MLTSIVPGFGTALGGALFPFRTPPVKPAAGYHSPNCQSGVSPSQKALVGCSSVPDFSLYLPYRSWFVNSFL